MIFKTRFIFLFLLLCGILKISAQVQYVEGTVRGISADKEKFKTERLPFASVYWQGGNISTTADENGKFTIAVSGNKELKLIASFVGYKADTVTLVTGQSRVDFSLISNATLNTVDIQEKLGDYISKIKPIKTEVITEDGLQKLACCNLSESFERTATVDVGYSDAVSGAKRIQMLGLSGIYSQILTENIPSVRGLTSSYGLSYIPGSWMHSILVSKGTSSVINGYESITGQINVEYKKPETNKEPLFFNLYGNSEGRFEGNLNSTIKINERWSTMILGHGSYFGFMIDRNNDSFLDAPKFWTANFMNRWQYEVSGKMHIQFGIGYLQDDKQGGQKEFYKAEEPLKPDFYGIGVDARQYSAFLKTGFFMGAHNESSLGIVSSFNRYELNSFYGKNAYDGTQNSVYVNLIFQSIMGNTNHKYSTGTSFMFDDYYETFNDSLFELREYVPGVFFQYSYTYPEKLNLIIGLRGDYNSEFGFFFTPRLHIKYDITDKLILRASAGRGYRSPHVIAENTSLLASSRSIIFESNMKAEEAWNAGINITKEFWLTESLKASLGADFYHTSFINQIIVDLDRSPQEAVFYNLQGRSYSNSLQIDGMIQPFKGFEITLAGRYNDVKKTIDGKFREAPYVSKFKGLITLSYATKFEKWKFDVTGQFNGKSRLPDTDTNPEPYNRPRYSKEYFMLHAQVTKKFKYIDIYLGAENITNYMQHHPIVSHEEPFGKYFDTSMIWGPMMGATIYAGLRLTIK
ncbi:MAG: TonB-dependent receptor [Bacteroidales bacterium]|jgi:outer membrane receptor protein involved in Fe transport|nr:TonB-dependent receptor [Bacteroidales bacterium]